VTAKPTVSDLGIDLAAQAWQRSGRGDGALEVAFARTEDGAGKGAEWVLMRVAGDPARRVLVFDRHEWECFLDGARNGEFDAAASRGDDDASRGDDAAASRGDDAAASP
jgi:hypothetical protein